MSEVAQKDMFTRRWRKVRAPEPAEEQMQIGLVAHLKARLRPDVVFWHTPNGGLRDQRSAAKFKAMGVKPGVADLTFVWKDANGLRNLYLELKSRTGKQTVEQSEFGLAMIVAGAGYGVAASLDEALNILKQHQLLRF